MKYCSGIILVEIIRSGSPLAVYVGQPFTFTELLKLMDFSKNKCVFWHFLMDWALLAAGCSCKPLELGHGNFFTCFAIEIPGRSALGSVRAAEGSQLLLLCWHSVDRREVHRWSQFFRLGVFFWLRFWAIWGLISAVNCVCPPAAGMGSAAVAPEAATKQIKSNFPAWPQ